MSLRPMCCCTGSCGVLQFEGWGGASAREDTTETLINDWTFADQGLNGVNFEGWAFANANIDTNRVKIRATNISTEGYLRRRLVNAPRDPNAIPSLMKLKFDYAHSFELGNPTNQRRFELFAFSGSYVIAHIKLESPWHSNNSDRPTTDDIFSLTFEFENGATTHGPYDFPALGESHNYELRIEKDGASYDAVAAIDGTDDTTVTAPMNASLFDCSTEVQFNIEKGTGSSGASFPAGAAFFIDNTETYCTR